MSLRKVLVTGATGKQGSAVIRALIAHPPQFDHKILALTRNTSSKAAQALASNENVELILGDLQDCNAIFEQTGGKDSIWGVFLVTVPQMKAKDAVAAEEQQGSNMIEAAVAHGVKHLVFSSVDRGGPELSDHNPTQIPHFIAKHNIELKLKMVAGGKDDMTWTIIRPTAFMDNCNPNMFGKLFATMWSQIHDKPLQLVAVKDIGHFAAQAFADHELDEYKNTAISLAGDDLTQKQANEVFWQVMGRPMPMTYGFMGTLLKTMVNEVGVMFKWFEDVGYGADIEHCRNLNSGMLDFAEYLREETKYQR